MQTQTRFSAELYNILPSVEDAYEQLQTVKDWQEVVRAGVRILSENGLEDSYGIWLCHRHFDCAADAYPLEIEVRDEQGKYTFITEIVDEKSPNVQPSRFCLGNYDNGIQPMEYSAAFNKEVPDISKTVLKQLLQWVSRSGAEGLLGLTIRYDVPEHFILLESTHLSPPHSCIRLEDKNHPEVSTSLPTIWTDGASGCCTPQTVCEVACTTFGGEHVGQVHASAPTGGHIGCV